MINQFDEIIDRKNTGSIKHDLAESLGMPKHILPLWVADMDFRSPPCVIDALIEKSRFGIFGYSESGQAYFDAVKDWFSSCHGWEVDQSWLVKTPGVVYAINTAIRALTFQGEGVLIQEPVYYPFAESIRENGRKVSVSTLRYAEGKYTIDFEDFEKTIQRDHVRMFILCSPHNPVGRVWTKDELMLMGEICHKNGVIVVSDEIHMDFTYEGHRHNVFASLKPEFLQNSVICTAPTKTFNLAGLQISNIFIPNEDLRQAFRNELSKSGHSQENIMAVTACKAAYLNGRQWLDALIAYLTGTIDMTRDFLNSRLPQIKMIEPEGTYLLWLDFQELGLKGTALEELIVQKAGLWLDKGTKFGSIGNGFQRINIASPRSIVLEALTRLDKAVKGGA
jgi:cystathionine beta-lyase